MSQPFQQILEDPANFPSLPDICHQIGEAVESPESSFEDIARVIESDAELSARLLSLANNAFYSYPITVANVPDALSVIGLQQIKNLALALSLPRALKRQLELPTFPVEAFWKHSVAVGLCARIIALDLREANTERHFLAGFLYKVGRLLIAARFPEEHARIERRVQQEDAPRHAIEQDALGFTSAEVVAAALAHWQLPGNVVELARHHAKPVLARRHLRGVSIVHVASFIVEALALGDSGDRFVPDFSEAAWGYTGLDESRLHFIVEELLRQWEPICRVLLRPA